MKTKNLTKQQQDELEKFGANTWFIEYLYEEFTKSPERVPEQWRKFFGDISNKEDGNGKNISTGLSLTSGNIPLPQPGENDELQIIAGSSEKILSSMVNSLSIPVATSQRTIPVKLLEENRTIQKPRQLSDSQSVEYQNIFLIQFLKAFLFSLQYELVFPIHPNKIIMMQRNFL